MTRCVSRWQLLKGAFSALGGAWLINLVSQLKLTQGG